MTRKEFIGPFHGFCEAFNRTFSTDGIDVWYAAVADLPREQFVTAVARFIREAGSRDFPTPGELRKFCPSGMRDDDRAAAAYVIAAKAARDWGGDRSIDFDDLVINATIRRMGGWEAFCERTGDNWKQRDFQQAYQSIARTGAGDGSPLLGMIARVNAGLPVTPPLSRVKCGLPAHPVAQRLTREEPVRIEQRPKSLRLIARTPEEVA